MFTVVIHFFFRHLHPVIEPTPRGASHELRATSPLPLSWFVTTSSAMWRSRTTSLPRQENSFTQTKIDGKRLQRACCLCLQRQTMRPKWKSRGGVLHECCPPPFCLWRILLRFKAERRTGVRVAGRASETLRSSYAARGTTAGSKLSRCACALACSLLKCP